jgi:hypothetical protein
MKLVTLNVFPSGRTGVLIGTDVLDFALGAVVVNKDEIPDANEVDRMSAIIGTLVNPVIAG